MQTGYLALQLRGYTKLQSDCHIVIATGSNTGPNLHTESES